MSGIKNLPSSPSKLSANDKAKEGKRQRPSFADSIYGSNAEGSGVSSIQVGAGPATNSPSSTSVSPAPNSQNPTSFGGVQLSESALAQRRSAYLPKLRQLSSNVTNLSFEQGSYRNEMGEINFVYGDCDTFAVELAELYSYSEMHEWATNLDSFTSYMRSKNLSPIWMGLEKREKQTVLADLVQSLERTSANERLEAARILLYILPGAFADFEEPYSEVVADSMEEARSNIESNNEEEFLENFCLLQAACNAYLAYEAGLFKALCEALLIEANEATDEHSSYAERGQSSLSNTRSVSSTDGASGVGSGEARGGRRPVTISENEMLRTTLSCLYHIVESIRRQEVLAKCTHVSDYSASHLEQLQQQFIKELREPIDCVDKPLLLFLLDLIPPFIRGACVKVPIKKVILLAWKTLLATFGGIANLRDLKAQKRRDTGLAAVEDTISVAIKMRSTNFSTDGQFAESTGTKVQRRYRGGIARGAFNRQQALTATQLSDDSSSPRDDKLPDEEDIGSMPPSQTSLDNPAETKMEEEKTENADQQQNAQENQVRDCDTPAPNNGNGGQRTPNGGERTPTATSPLPNLLPWTSKVRQCEVEQFIQNERMKFCGYKLPRDGVSLFGLPPPIQKSVEALNRHVYVSLGEKQIAEEKLLNKYPFSRKEDPYDSPIESIYKKMIPNLPTDSICFLKVLLAAIPSAKIQTKSDSAHILADVLTNKCPETSDLLSTSLNLDVTVSSHNVLEDAIRLAIDINRHKEIIVKATTALILNLLKFFRLSHVYEFENLSQQLVLTNCLPLILKFLDQNMVKYFQSKNELAPLCFPKAVVHYARNKREWPILNADNVGADQSDNQSYFLWRNVFASVNLLRILNKLTKNKHSRTMMLVVFKSTPILKRCLKLRSGIFQFYTLKLLKMQARYLGRAWRRTNMDIISAIYMKLRHRLNDDWAFANETRCKSWDFQSEERQLKSAIERFNMRRYGHLYPDLALQMDVKDSISGVAGANAGKLLGANEGEQDENNLIDEEPEDEEDDYDPNDFLPVDNNLCSVLGEQVEFTPHFKRNYEKWLDEVVFKQPVNWDNVIMPTEKLEILLKQEA